MSVSEAADIIGVIAGMAVNFGDVAPTIKALDDAPSKVETAQLPIRIIIPVQPRMDTREMQFITIGQGAKMAYLISDLLLIKALGNGPILVGEKMADMVNYSRRYMRAVQTTMGNVPGRVMMKEVLLDRAESQPGIWEYPEGSGNYYKGVLCMLTLVEFLPLGS